MLSGKIAIITGSARGIGRAVAKVMARYGAKTALFDIDEKGLEETADSILASGGDAICCKVDISKKNECEQAVSAVAERYGTIDILANCAGIICPSLLENLSEDDWNIVMDVNLKGSFLMGQAVSKIMIQKKYGKIVNISSQAGKIGEAGNGPYCVSKAGIVMLTQVQALELAAYNINVNAVSPGYTDTIIMERVFQERGPIMGMTPEEYKNELLEGVPLKRMAQPEEIGELMAFLASDKSSYITGITHTIAGGKVLV